jgi:hypothetical protein
MVVCSISNIAPVGGIGRSQAGPANRCIRPPIPDHGEGVALSHGWPSVTRVLASINPFGRPSRRRGRASVAHQTKSPDTMMPGPSMQVAGIVRHYTPRCGGRGRRGAADRHQRRAAVPAAALGCRRQAGNVGGAFVDIDAFWLARVTGRAPNNNITSAGAAAGAGSGWMTNLTGEGETAVMDWS